MRRLSCTLIVIALAGCAHDSSLNARVANAEQLAHDADDDLKQADRLMKGGTDLDKAADLLRDAKDKVADRAMAFYADKENLEDRISQAESRLSAAKDAKLRRDIAAQIPERKEKCERLVADFRSGADALQDRQGLDRKRTKQARDAMESATRFLDESKSFEIDGNWLAYAQGARRELAQRQVQVTLAEAILTFYEGPVARNNEAKGLFDKSKTAKKPEEKTALMTQARDAYLSCNKTANDLLAATPALEREALALGGPKVNAKTFAAACDAQAKSVDGILNPGKATATTTGKPGATPGKQPTPTQPPKKKK
jgi:predicted  nucleic acid-binding Zn-ribbon protein